MPVMNLGHPQLPRVRLPPAPDWNRASCARTGHPEWWSGVTTTDGGRPGWSPGWIEAAAHVCSGCPVRESCREWSMHLPVSDTAVYAGLTRDQRAAERRLRRKAEALAQRSAPGQYNAAKTHCGTCGRPYSGDNLVMVRGKSGMQRGCRACRTERKRIASRLARQARRQAAA